LDFSNTRLPDTNSGSIYTIGDSPYYEKALAYFQAYYSTNQDAVSDSAQEFIRAYRESIFLFGLDSDVYKVLTELKDKLSFLLQFEKKFSSKTYDHDEYVASSNIRDEKRDLHVIMKSLEEALMPWLDFKKVEN